MPDLRDVVSESYALIRIMAIGDEMRQQRNEETQQYVMNASCVYSLLVTVRLLKTLLTSFVVDIRELVCVV